MTISVAIFVFPNVELLDFAGPYEVFTTASRVFSKLKSPGPAPFSVFTIAEEAGAVRARAGLVVTPDCTFCEHLPIDLLIIPGGIVTAELENSAVRQWIERTAAFTLITAAVCTGSFLLAQSGLLAGKSATTHWEDLGELKAMFPSLTVIEDRRWVDEGTVVTSAGISAGIDMSLHLVARLGGKELALKTARQMDYNWRENP
jgi:transcriptional regulator GlxA family with amidase domain